MQEAQRQAAQPTPDPSLTDGERERAALRSKCGDLQAENETLSSSIQQKEAGLEILQLEQEQLQREIGRL